MRRTSRKPRGSRKPTRTLRRNAETLYFRGSQGRDPAQTRLTQLSFTPCLGAALVYSAVPADAWSSSKTLSKTHFVPDSTVSAATIRSAKTLDWMWLSMSLGDVLRSLRFGKENGITEEEVRRVLNYLDKRAVGRVAAGEFKYKIFDEDGEAYERGEEPWALLSTGIGYIRDEWDGDPSIGVVERLAADTFVFVDTPLIQKVAERLGFQAVRYIDAFTGAKYAFRDLLKIEPEDVECLEEEMDLEDDYIWSHETLRPLTGADVEYVWQGPAQAVAQDVLAGLRRDDDEVAANPRRRR